MMYGDLEYEKDLISFFNQVLERREELDARGMEDEALVVEPLTADDASLEDTSGHTSLGTQCTAN